MTKYYVGYIQGNESYVYVAGVDNTNVRISTTLDGAMAFDTKDLAKDLQNIATSLVANQDFIVLEIKTDIKEVK